MSCDLMSRACASRCTSALPLNLLIPMEINVMSLSSESILSRTPGSFARSSHVGRQVAPLPEASDDPKASTQAFTCDTNLRDLCGEQAERAYWHLALNCPYKESTARQIAEWIQRQRPTTSALAQPITPSQRSSLHPPRSRRRPYRMGCHCRFRFPRWLAPRLYSCSCSTSCSHSTRRPGMREHTVSAP